MLDLIQIKLTNYFTPFENCTIITYTTKHLEIRANNFVPIILIVYDQNTSSTTGFTITHKFSLQARRNPSFFCWATINILPEKGGGFDKKNLYFMLQPSYIGANWASQYFIFVTTIPRVVQEHVRTLAVSVSLVLREVLIVDVKSLLKDSAISYHNIYHIKAPVGGLEKSREWYHIAGLPSECFNRISSVSKNISNLNKYFWGMQQTFSRKVTDIRYIFKLFDVPRISNSLHRIAKITSFDGFLAFWILQDVLTYKVNTVFLRHRIPPIARLTEYMGQQERFTFFNYDIQSFSFVSCYQIKSNSTTIFSGITSPFDSLSWTAIGISFIIVVLILTVTRGKFVSDGFFFIIAISLESSVPSSGAASLSKQKCSGSYFIIILWTFLVGTISSNWYKTAFTMEMIVPTMYTSPWKSVVDVEGSKILIPFILIDEYEHVMPPPADFYRYKNFYLTILMKCERMVAQRAEYKRLKKTAVNLISLLLPYFGMDADFRTVKNSTFTPYLSSPIEVPPYNKSALYDYPIQPIEYDEKDSYGITKTLSTCGKVALVDAKENIARITRFLNDNQEKIVYVKGDGDSFFASIRGWTMPPVRENYAEKRLKVMVTSGIFAHWEFLYKLWKPKKLLGDYANWTHPRYTAVSQLDFNSKITKIFYMCGLFLIICTFVLIGESVRYRYMQIRN
ncbi:hypothetical protein Fcan01_19157 [Folsomia candida]|uniref:Uncharacterized protein n=1 Tax=Folsomia candida TaxID=158441 RepID=A0A226DM45_FOLCA|nr:hypothetical protein Fcan01_19157 [Folsomia candida]